MYPRSFCYLILSPRTIPEVRSAFSDMDYTKIWLKGFTESELHEKVLHIVSITNFDYYMICGDDMIPTTSATRTITKYADTNLIFTGYSELSVGDTHVNLTETPLNKNAEIPTDSDYNYYTFQDIEEKVGKFQSYYAGFSMTCVPREILAQVGLKPMSASGKQTDYYFSLQMKKRNIPIYSHKEAYVKHLKDNSKSLNQYWYNGPQQVIIEQ